MVGENLLTIHEIYAALTLIDVGSRQAWASESAAAKQADDNTILI